MDLMGDIAFIRIPKNASTSIYSFLGNRNIIRNELLDMNNDKYLNIFEPSHCTLSEAVEFFGEEILDKPVLAVIRNPYDRLVSMFFFARKYDLGKIYGIDTEDFDLFAEKFYEHSHDDRFFHATSQKEFISHGGHVPDICRFENLNEDIANFIEKNNIDIDASRLEKLNSTEHNSYAEYYSDSSKGIVEKMWGDDIEYFSYNFGEQ